MQSFSTTSVFRASTWKKTSSRDLYSRGCFKKILLQSKRDWDRDFSRPIERFQFKTQTLIYNPDSKQRDYRWKGRTICATFSKSLKMCQCQNIHLPSVPCDLLFFTYVARWYPLLCPERQSLRDIYILLHFFFLLSFFLSSEQRFLLFLGNYWPNWHQTLPTWSTQNTYL